MTRDSDDSVQAPAGYYSEGYLYWLLLAVIVIALFAVLVGLFGHAGAAANTPTPTPPDYYNETVVLNNDSWMDGNENATLDSTLTLFGRIGTFVVGSGGDSAAVGGLLTSTLAGAVVMGMLGGASVGIVGGVTVAILALGTMSFAGLVPVWLWAMAVFGVGLVLATVVIRALK